MVLRDVLEESFEVLGSARVILLDLLKEHGLDLDNKERSYSLDKIEQIIGEVFGKDVSDLILSRVKQVSAKYGTNNFTRQVITPRTGPNETSNYGQETIKGIISLPLTSKQVNHLYSAVSNMIEDIQNPDEARRKFGSRGEHYIEELRKELPGLQKLLLEHR